MNWYRAKTILIIIFLLADLFLLWNIIGSTIRQTTVSPEIISSTAAILKNHGISINTDIIPSKTIPVPYAEADNVICDYSAFSELFLGDNLKMTQEHLYESPTGTVQFSGDSFSYKSKKSIVASHTDEKEARLLAITFLKDRGFDISKAEISTDATSGKVLVVFFSKLHSLPLFNSKVTIEISGKDVVSASGIWFNATNAKGQDNELKSVTAALIDFIPYVKSTPTKISSLELGYTVPDSSVYHKSAVLIPVWQITEENGSTHYPDARNPE